MGDSLMFLGSQSEDMRASLEGIKWELSGEAGKQPDGTGNLLRKEGRTALNLAGKGFVMA